MQSSQSDIYDLAIIGAGPAGMMAALRAAECGAKVVLLEKNTFPGMKLLMTGKERCNITNDENDVRDFAANFGKNGKFLLTALYHFGVSDIIEYFHNNKIKTKTERGGRVFPESDRATDVRAMFERLIKESSISMVTGCRIKKIDHKQGAIEKIYFDDNDEIKARK